MAELMKYGIQISEIYSEKPDLEAVFVEMINKPDDKHGLLDLLNGTAPVNDPGEPDGDEEPGEDNTDEKEDDE